MSKQNFLTGTEHIWPGSTGMNSDACFKVMIITNEEKNLSATPVAKN
jgi:hypothetical protein